LYQRGIVGRGQRAALDRRGESGHLDNECRVGGLARSNRHVEDGTTVALMVEVNPQLGTYGTMTSREIPVFVIERKSP
jgi:hypothetical protein